MQPAYLSLKVAKKKEPLLRCSRKLSCTYAVGGLCSLEGIMTMTTGGYNGFNMAFAVELVPWALLTVLCSDARYIMKVPK